MPLQSVNDFVVRFANVNGSGSASANELFARSVLRMGIPVAPRNIFPSNIQGLPTWYEVRISEAGHLGARGGTDLMVAMNPQTWDKDVAGIEPGGYLLYDSTKPMPKSKFRDDITVIGIPLTAICNREYTDPRQRQLFKNIIYVGALSALLDMDVAEMEKLIAEQFKGKEKLFDANKHALHLGRDWVMMNLDHPIGLRLKRAAAVGDRIFLEGNSAAALGAVYGGATVCAWYPITPSSSLAEAFTRYCGRLRVDPGTKKNKFAIVQAEDELASIGMVIGAGWNGARAFTATSGPGISLMQEFLGLAYFAEIPGVIFDVQRAGPSTGMPTRTQQTDIISCAYASHGDTKHVLLFPEDPAETFEFAAEAFDLAERLQTPVFVMMDLDIGMNHRLCRPLKWDDAKVYDRGKVMTAAELEAGKDFGRYLDVDGDGIPYRTYPGTHPTKGSFFTRGTSRDRYARYTEEGAPYADNMQRLLRKFETAKDLVPRPLQANATKPTKYGVIYYGSTSPAMDEAIHMIEANGQPLDRLRVRAFPFHSSVTSFIAEHDFIFVVEQNRDAQLRSLIVNECGIDPVTARTDPALRRHADHRAIYRQRHRRASRRLEGDTASEGWSMTYVVKPKFHHPELPKNELGYTHRDYEGSISTLCAGCGHNSISSSIIEACFELSIEPHRVAKLSGIGCSSKTPTYFLGNSHGFNSVHGRMPSVLTGANLANRELIYLGVSGDGDSASIGFGQFAHALRRGVNMVYIVENNGVYGLTKGQFSATADRGSKSKRGVVNTDSAIDMVGIALQLGATFVARSFSGDKKQLTPIIKAAIEHEGAAFIDVISPCVAFNNHAGSTKSFDYVREHNEAVNYLDFITGRAPIHVDYAPGTVELVEQHDGTTLALRKINAEYDVHDRLAAMSFLQHHAAKGQIVTGLLYVAAEAADLHGHLNTVDAPLNKLSEKELCPGSAALEKINASLR